MRAMKSVASLVVALLVGGAGAAAEPTRHPFPEIQFTDRAGAAHSLKDLRGTVTVLNFWATWCGPCRMELPELQGLSNQLGARGFSVLTFAVDTPPPLADRFAKEIGLALPVYFLDRETEGSLGIDRIPFTVLLDREGKVVRIYAGFSYGGMKDLKEYALRLLDEKAPGGGT